MTRQLLVRVDDAGSSLAANEGCCRAVTDGVARSVEVMMPGAWVEDAAQRFARVPSADIGIHLTLTSEWDRVRWRPLTQAASLIDQHGFFKPLLKARPGDERPCLEASGYDLAEVEAESRAQIELGLKLFPKASHISSHMARHFEDFDTRLGAMVRVLCKDYGLRDDPMGTNRLRRIEGYPAFPRDAQKRVTAFLEALAGLRDGASIFVDHPASFSDEMRAHGHPGYEDVAEDRDACLAVLTHPQVIQAVHDNDIELINYRDLN